MSVSVPLDDVRAARLLGRMARYLALFPREFEANKVSALNRTGTGVRTEAVKMLTQRYAAKQGDVKRKFTLTKASGGRPYVIVRGEGRPLHLGLWPQRPARVYSTSRRRLKGVKVKILKGSGFTLVKGGFGGMSSKNNAYLVYEREGRQRLPVRVLYGPSMIGHLTRPGNVEFLQQYAEARLTREIRQGAEFRLRILSAL